MVGLRDARLCCIAGELAVVDHIVERVAARLRDVPGVTGVVLGGSRALGSTSPEADIDVGVYYRAAGRPDVEELRRAATELDDRGEPGGFAGYGDWGPWINGGAWLVVGGQRTDLLWREIELFEEVRDECSRGVVRIAYQPGHPHCFTSAIYLGELHHGVVLADADGAMERLKASTSPYPEPLAEELTKRFGWEADFSLMTARSSAARGDVAYVTACLYRSLASMVQALFAANRAYLLNEKGSLERAETLPECPPEFRARAEAVLAEIGREPAELERALRGMTELEREVADIAARPLRGPSPTEENRPSVQEKRG
ncbi:MAG: nucleotidyltransferase domain-containing protein [Gaiellaceae bacterium]